MCNEVASRTHESDCAIWLLEFMYVMGIPSHLGFGCETENDFCLVGDGREVRNVDIHGVYVIVHIHLVKI